jgi:hypothetical protein
MKKPVAKDQNDDLFVVGELELAPEFAASLGDMFAHWSHFEHTTVGVLESITGLPRGMCEDVLYSLKNTSARLDILQSLSKRHLADRAERGHASRAIAYARKCAGRRNKFVHHLIGVNTRTHEVRLFDYRVPVGHQRRKLNTSVDEVRTLTNSLRHAMNLLIRINRPEVGDPPAIDGIIPE